MADLAKRITEVYWLRVRDTGLGQAQTKTARIELETSVAKCLDHFESTAPEEVARLERTLESYDRLRAAAGIERSLLEEPSRLLPGVLGHVQAVAEAALGALPALFGLLTSGIPYLVTRVVVRRPDMNSRRTLVRVVTFTAFYSGLVGLVAWRFSGQATLLLEVLLIPTGVFARGYAQRMRTIVAHLGNRTASWFKLGAVASVREAQSELVGSLDVLRNRYRAEALGLTPLPAHYRRRTTRAALARVTVIAALTAGAVLFINAYADRPVQGLPLGPSPWQATRRSDPAAAERELLRDARGVLLAAQQLDRMEAEVSAMIADFSRGERSLLTQADHDGIRALLLAYLDLRSALLKTVWLYRGDNTEAPVATDDPLEGRAFLTAYTAAVLLIEKAWWLYETFRDDPTTRAQLDRADLAWGIPPGTFSNLAASLTNQSVMAELRVALRRFESRQAAGTLPAGAPWGELATRARLSRPAVMGSLDGIGSRRLDRTFREMVRQLGDPAAEITPVVSMAVSRFRFKERPPHRGLISPEQLEDLRAELKPGDILIERRNWYISNSLLPGFWPHAALYMGSYEELRQLGVDTDPRAAPHMLELQGQNELGDDFAVLEAIGEGVIFTSFEQSVGEADAVAVLRPRLSEEALRDALSRALTHRGKEYDFDFDFETTDRLVCTELIFRAYDGILEIPEMRLIMGKPRIAASDYVRMWAEGLGSDTPQLELVGFLDFDERNGVAVEADAETLVETLERSRFTFAN